jgi:hypothetical protein
MLTPAEKQLKEVLKKRFPDRKLSKADFKECKQSLIYLGKAIHLYLLQQGGKSER